MKKIKQNIETKFLMSQLSNHANALITMGCGRNIKPKRTKNGVNLHDVRTYPKIRRNELCDCGSGKKYKNCCMF